MKALNAMEIKVLEMIACGKPLHGMAREIAIEMQLRELDEREG